MKTRKLVLLIADILLLVALILQCAVKPGDKVKTFNLKDTPDEIVFTTPTENYSFVKENDVWLAGEKKYPTNDNYVKNVIDSLTSIKVLDKVAEASSDVVLNKYEMTEGKNIIVVAKKDGKVLRTLNIGKQATTGSQNYIMIDDSKDIYLASGGLRSALDRDLNYFRTRIVYSLKKDEISSVNLKYPDGKSWTVSRTGVGDDFSWVINVPDVLVDSTKAANWFNDLATVSTPVWHDDADLQGNQIVTAEITCGSKVVTMQIFEIPAATEEDKPLYYGYSSETPYQFELASYTVNKFRKNLDDIIQ